MNEANKSNRNKNSISAFLSLPSSPVMAILAVGSSVGESASLTLNKTESLESKFLRASSQKKLVCRRLSLLNKCIGEEIQGRLETNKELKIFGKDFKRQILKLNTRNINKEH